MLAGFGTCFDLYLPLADDASVYDNSNGEPTLVAERFAESDLLIRDIGRWAIRSKKTGR